MLRANVYTQPARTPGRVNKSTMSATTQATTDNTRSHVTREREREDGVRSGNPHPSSVRGRSSTSGAASRSIASHRTSAAGRNHLTGRASNGRGGNASTSRRASNSLRSNASMNSRRAQSLRRRGALPGDGIIPCGVSGSSQRSSSRRITSQTSTINSRCPPPEIFIHPSSNADAQSVQCLTSTSLYTSSSHSTTIITDLYDAPFCLDRVKHYADRFLFCLQLEDTLYNRIMIEDELNSIYHQYYQLGAVQADVAMAEIFTLTYSLPTSMNKRHKRQSNFVEVQEMLRTT